MKKDQSVKTNDDVAKSNIQPVGPSAESESEVSAVTGEQPAAEAEKGNPVGRPGSYRPEYESQATRLARLGLTDEQMAAFFGVAVSTFYLWKKDHPEFSEALKQGKILSDANVAARLYKRAIGYEYTETSTEDRPVKNGDGNIVTVPVTKIVSRHVPPDATAAIFWLKNRQPALWRDRKEVTGRDGEPLIPSPIDTSRLSDAALRELEAATTEAGETAMEGKEVEG